VPAIMLPYPYHKDQHQRLNGETLVKAGGGVIVEDRPQEPERTAQELWGQLKTLMSDGKRLTAMAAAAKGAGRPDAAQEIAKHLMAMAQG